VAVIQAKILAWIEKLASLRRFRFKVLNVLVVIPKNGKTAQLSE